MAKNLFNPFTGNFDVSLDKAAEIKYDNASSGLTATDVQAAVDEVESRLDATETVASAAIPSTEKGAALGVATLDAGGKVPVTQLPSAVMTYEGMWAASTNTPTLADGVGDAGQVYIASDSGTVDFGSGPITFAAGDWVIYSGSVWQKSDNTDEVVSVNGFTGVVVLDTDDVAEGATNLYFTDERAQDAIGGALVDGTTVDFTYNDGANTISAEVAAGSLTDAEISTGAAIMLSKLAAVTANRAIQSSANGVLEASAVTSTELGYLSGTTSSVQTQLNSKFGIVIVSVTSNTSAVAATTYLADSTGGAFNITLPAPAANAFVQVKDSGGASNTNAITVFPNGAETIDGAASFVINSNYASHQFVSDGLNWYVI